MSFTVVTSLALAVASLGACSSRQVSGIGDPGNGNENGDGDGGTADAGAPQGTAQELCDHYAACAKSAGPLDGGTDGAPPPAPGSEGVTPAQGETCNRAREATFQSKPAAHCGCMYANECPGSACDLETGECADSPRVLCKEYCGRALFVDSCTAKSCADFCAQFLPTAKEKCKAALDPFMACAKAEAIPNYRCASYILAPSFPVPINCDAQYKVVADCVY